VISTGRKRTQLGPMGMNSEREMLQKETNVTLVLQYVSNRRDIRGSASRLEMGT
jgi:hypothetical protein